MQPRRDLLRMVVFLLVGGGLACGLINSLGGWWLIHTSQEQMAALPPNMPADAQAYGFFLGILLILGGILLALLLIYNGAILAFVRRRLRANRYTFRRAMIVWLAWGIGLPVLLIAAGCTGLSALARLQ